MTLSDQVLNELKNVVGEQWASNDPVIIQAYSRTRTGIPIEGFTECIILPKTREEVQAIFRLANRFSFYVIPIGSFYFMSCVPMKPGYVMIDPKRMDKLWIDERNMYAVVEPYVTFAQLQTEAMKKGLTCYISGAGSQISVLANLVFQGMGLHGYRYGIANKSMLALDWVLPTGELLHIGSATNPKAGYFWGEGPGIDLRGLVKGIWGYAGGLGMCTKVALKLFPWAGPPTLPITGVSPEKLCKLPLNLFKFYIVCFPTMQKVIDVIYELGHAEIGGKCTFWASAWYTFLTSLSKKELMELHEQRVYKDSMKRTLVFMIEGHKSEKQVAYEEKVFKEIIEEYKGEFLPEEKNKWFAERLMAELLRSNLITRLWRISGKFHPLKLGMDTLDHTVEIHESTLEMVKKYVKKTPDAIYDDDGEGIWINPYNLAHEGHAESALAPIGDKGQARVQTIGLKVLLDDIKNNRRSLYAVLEPVIRLFGPAANNFHKYVFAIKKTFDPNNISNPPYPIDLEKEV
ncbi:MAG: FAD-binding protein [Candidatus Helarchaeota archaeon]|nr:FAD-binding protein [Candidatus Helarchaeota archaeon]